MQQYSEDAFATGSTQTTTLRLLATTDLHMHLLGYNYYADQADKAVGLTRTAQVIARERDKFRTRDGQSPGTVLLFDNGDAFQGTPMDELPIGHAPEKHPMMQAFEHLRYDVLGLGNHDFNHGLDALRARLAQAHCPVVCSNMRLLEGTAEIGFAPFTILDRTVTIARKALSLRIGVLSMLPPQTVEWDHHLLAGQVEVEDILTCARRMVPQLRAQECDVVIILAHSGIGHAEASDGMENAVIPLAALDGVDAIIAGHTHQRFPGDTVSDTNADNAAMNAKSGRIHGTPVINPGSSGSYLGVIDLNLKRTEDDQWQVISSTSTLRPITEPDGTALPEDSKLAELIAPFHRRTRARMGDLIGHTSHDLHSYFTFLGLDRGLATVAAAQSDAMKPFLTGTEAENLPLLSAVAPAKFGERSGPQYYTDVPKGPVALRHLADLHVFPNELKLVVINGDQVVDWLEMSASLFRQARHGEPDHRLIDPNRSGHSFDCLFGLRYQIDLSVPARFHIDGTVANDSQRIRNLTWLGRRVTPDQKFAVAVNSYRVNGGGHFAALKGVRALNTPRVFVRDALCDYFRNAPARRVSSLCWSFAPLSGFTITLKTGPGAIPHLHELADLGITRTGPDPDGFLHISFPLW